MNIKGYTEKAIAIQGIEGSFHQEAAWQFFGKGIPVICCTTFRELIKTAQNKKESGGAVMAIENSIAGSILPNYNLLQKADLQIIGEVYLQIKQQLMVNPGVKMEDIREVHSHPIALLQCIDFLDKQGWKLIETDDTALSAKNIHQYKSRHIAGVASKLAAELYKLKIIAPNIQTQKNNYTRFLILQHKDNAAVIANADKASINFCTDHSRGSLAGVLTKIAAGGINLSKLQSMPLPGGNWKYSFHADLEFDTRIQFEKVIKNIKPLTGELKVFGVYKNGKTST